MYLVLLLLLVDECVYVRVRICVSWYFLEEKIKRDYIFFFMEDRKAGMYQKHKHTRQRTDNV